MKQGQMTSLRFRAEDSRLQRRPLDPHGFVYRAYAAGKYTQRAVSRGLLAHGPEADVGLPTPHGSRWKPGSPPQRTSDASGCMGRSGPDGRAVRGAVRDQPEFRARAAVQKTKTVAW